VCCLKLKGWILDLYPVDDEMVLWIKTPEGKSVRVKDEYYPSFFVYAPAADLTRLRQMLSPSKSIKTMELVKKRIRLADLTPREVLKIEVAKYDCFSWLVHKIAKLGRYEKYQLFNVDMPFTQTYLYDHDLYPMGLVEVETHGNHTDFTLQDDLGSETYEIPKLKCMYLDVSVAKAGKIPTYHDPISQIKMRVDDHKEILNDGDERERILGLVDFVWETDPDMIFTRNGDTFVLPYLIRRALVNSCLKNLVLGREKTVFEASTTGRKGSSYFSYGKVYYKPPPYRLLGRIHIDVENSFVYADCGLEGLIELSRVTRIPVQRLSRATIGTGLTSMQLYQAQKDGVLIPWKKSEPEAFKSGLGLLVADRGGFVFEPKLGIHEDVGELDFVSLYPSLMAIKNISPETVLCECCANPPNRVPVLGYHICARREGLIPRVLKPILKKRINYKRLRLETRDPALRKTYEHRQHALKFILVCSFGYLGYRNARFGRIEAHEAVCSFARETLLTATSTAEAHGFEVVHGIVDSLFLKKKNVTDHEFAELCNEISGKIGVPLGYEGRFKWIVFLPSKIHVGVPVLNRFYGVYAGGQMKARGLALRRRDTPELVRQAQGAMLVKLTEANDSTEFREKIPEAIQILRKYAEKLLVGDVSTTDLSINKQLSKNPATYAHEVFQAIAAHQLVNIGVDIQAGQTVEYVILDADAERLEDRVKPVQFLELNSPYDRDKYLELLLSAGEELLSPFGYTTQKLEEPIFNYTQALLEY